MTLAPVLKKMLTLTAAVPLGAPLRHSCNKPKSCDQNFTHFTIQYYHLLPEGSKS